MKKISKTYDIEKIILEIESLGIKEDTKQISLQSPDGSWETGTGRISKANELGLTEKDFDHINVPESWELYRFIKEQDLVRTRVMKINPRSCYSWHKDLSPRIHLALETHPHCFLIENEKMIHIPADGHPYLIDTTNYHTAINCTADLKRTHLVGAIRDYE
jgi:hypothetical protein